MGGRTARQIADALLPSAKGAINRSWVFGLFLLMSVRESGELKDAAGYTRVFSFKRRSDGLETETLVVR